MFSRIRLGDVLTIKHGFAFPGSGFVEDTSLPTLVTPGNFAVGGGFKQAKTKTFLGEYPAEFELHEGQLIVSMTDLSKEGVTLGLPAVIPGDRKYLHNQRIGLVRITDPTRIDPGFLHYFFRTAEYRAHVLATASGSTVRHTSPSRISDFVAYLPQLDAQRAIAEVLAALDDKIAANLGMGSAGLSLAHLLFRKEVDGFPECAMSSVLTPILGGTPSRGRDEYWAGSRPWASAKDVTGATLGVIFNTEEQITDRAVSETKAKPLQAGGVILTARGTVGAVARVAQSTSFNQSCYGFAPGLIPAAALYFVVLECTEKARAMVHGSVFDTITMRTFDHLRIPSLTAAEWVQLEARIEPLLSLANAMVEESLQLAQLRDALLPGLMSGKIRVKDAERVAGEAI